MRRHRCNCEEPPSGDNSSNGLASLAELAGLMLLVPVVLLVMAAAAWLLDRAGGG